jgi:CrcB protein
VTAWGYLAAVLACGLGAAGRYSLGVLRRPHQFPWPTLVANIVGTAVLAGAARAVADGAPDWVLLVLGAGLAGGITTFSALALDAVTLWGAGRRAGAAWYLAATLASGVVAAWLAWTIVGL